MIDLTNLTFSTTFTTLALGLVTGLAVNVLATLLPLVGRQPVNARLLNRSLWRRPWRWVAVTTATAALGWGAGTGALPAWTAFCLLVLLLIAIIDLEQRLVLNIVVGPMVLLTLAMAAMQPAQPLGPLLLGGGTGFLAFFLLAMLRPGAMGMGDVKLAGLLGLLVGFPAVVDALLLGILAGGLATLFLLLTRRAGRTSTMAYAPYLAAGGALILLEQANWLGAWSLHLGVLS